MDFECLKAGDTIEFSGTVFTARDSAHKRICECIHMKQPLPFDLKTAVIFYAGPAEKKPNEVIGSCGPTSSSRMDDYTPLLLENGLRVMIGKGKRSEAVRNAIKKHRAIYLCAVGGAGALIKSAITSCECIAYPELMTEAVYRLDIKKLPLIVAIDSKGNSIFSL